LGGRNFCPLALSAPKARLGWERFRHSAFSGISKQKSFLFLLEEKNQCAQIKNCEENFFAGWRASASGGGAERQSSQSGFSSKKVRILTKRRRNE